MQNADADAELSLAIEICMANAWQTDGSAIVLPSKFVWQTHSKRMA
jgi:hypothetical protein